MLSESTRGRGIPCGSHPASILVAVTETQLHRFGAGQRIESTVRYLGIEIDDAIEIAVKIEI
jgi:hypothetical protein